MLRVTLRGLMARKVRLLLSALAVVLGVAMVSGTYVLTDTIGSAFEHLFSSINKNTAVAVRGTTGAGFSNTDSQADRAPLPDSLLPTVAAVPGVREADPNISGSAQIINSATGQPIAVGQAPGRGVNYTGTPLATLTIRAGRAPFGDQIAVDKGTFEKAHLKLGQLIQVQAGTLKAQAYQLVGVVTVGDVNSLGGATLAAFDTVTAQRVLLKPGQLSQITVAADAGVSQSELASRIKKAVGTSADVVTGNELNQQTTNGIKSGLGFFNTILTVFGGIALIVGLFVIGNTFAMLIGQRARELALLRAVGASRGQVVRSVLAEGFAVGLVGSVIGLGLGIGIAITLKAVLSSLGLDLPSAGIVIKARTIVLALALGIIATTLAALFPSIRASRVPPVAAMSETFTLPTRSLRTRGFIGLVFLVASLAVLFSGASGNGTQAAEVVGLGAVLGLIAVVILAPLVAKPIVHVVAAPIRRLFGPVGKLASENAGRNPRRTAATASAIMIGLALVTAVGVLASSIKSSVKTLVSQGTGATYLLLGSGSQPLPTTLTADLTGQPGIAQASGLAIVSLRINGSRAAAEATTPAALTNNILLTPLSGELTLSPTTILISQKTADEKHWKIGTTLPVSFSEGGSVKLKVAGVYKENQLAGAYLIDRRTAARYVTNLVDLVVLVQATPQADVTSVRATIQSVLKQYPGIEVKSRGEYIQSAQDNIAQLTNLIYGLLALSVLIAFAGIINTLALSVIERTREIGLLRAVGMTRRQVAGMILLESLVIALFGAVLGIAVGSLFGWAILPPLADQGLTDFSYPFLTVVIFLFLGGLAGIAAGFFPGLRAAKLNVLQAISTT
jgi:putative ABC transport system permease protein